MEERLRYLFRRYTDNTCTYKELEEFFHYINVSGHDEAIRSCINRLYNDLNEDGSPATHVDEKGRLFLHEPVLLPAAPVKELPPKNHWKSWASIAAMVILMAATILFIRKNSPGSQRGALSSTTTKSTNRSEYKFILLEDSTSVWLNAASSLAFPDHFGQNKREVTLTGEAYFDVKHADKIPFIIHTGTVSTTVLGTAFNIKAYPGEKNITVSVSRGSVKVSRPDGWIATLTRGQQLKVQEEEIATALERTVPLSEIAAWQQGTIVYDDEILSSIIADLQRVYNVNITLADKALKDLHISTSFKKDIGVEQALHLLCKLTDTELKSVNGNYVIK